MLGKIESSSVTEDEMVGWHHLLNGHAFEQTLGDSEHQGSLICYSPWGLKESDMTRNLTVTTTLNLSVLHILQHDSDLCPLVFHAASVSPSVKRRIIQEIPVKALLWSFHAFSLSGNVYFTSGWISSTATGETYKLNAPKFTISTAVFMVVLAIWYFFNK